MSETGDAPLRAPGDLTATGPPLAPGGLTAMRLPLAAEPSDRLPVVNLSLLKTLSENEPIGEGRGEKMFSGLFAAATTQRGSRVGIRRGSRVDKATAILTWS